MSEIKVNSIVDASGGNTATINGVVPNVNNIRGKNWIINGDFQVSQRGDYTSLTGIGGNDYGMDRWKHAGDTNHYFQDLSNGYMRCEVIGAGSHSMYTQQTVENFAGRFAGKTVTLSGKCNTNSSNIRVWVYEAGSWVNKGSITTGDFSFTFTVVNGGSNDHTEVRFSISDSSSPNVNTTVVAGEYFEIGFVQLEFGDTASGFETLSYGETLALCQRYYELCGGISGTAYQIAANGISGNYSYNVTKRAPATLNTVTVPDFSNTSSLTGIASTTTGFGYYCLVTSTGSASFGIVTSGVISADAEL